MKVLMFGWEFPPFFAGGVGMVCYEIVKELSQRGASLTYVMPFGPDNLQTSLARLIKAETHIKSISTEDVDFTIKPIPSLLSAYQTYDEYEEVLINAIKRQKTQNIRVNPTKKLYGENMLEETFLFAERVRKLLLEDGSDYDVIHAQDWTTFPAAIMAKKVTGLPLVVHVHITEFDKTGGQGANAEIYNIEKEGMTQADRIISVSNKIKDTLVSHYGIDPNKIDVVHNGGVEMAPVKHTSHEIKGDNKMVLFAGRVTLQKGPEYFINAAKLVLDQCPNTKFVMAGSGDKLASSIQLSKDLGIYDKFYFHGFYTKEDAELFYDLADVFVMPSVSEPFGVVPLEAMCKKTPTIVSKQSGVSEVINHCFKVDFWDIKKMASQIIALLKFPALYGFMQKNGYTEGMKVSNWKTPVDGYIESYKKAGAKI